MLRTQGDIEAIVRKLKKAEKIDRALLNAAKRAVGGEVKSLVELGFRAAKDPSGKKWEPLKKPSKKRGGDSSIPLNDTGRLRASFSYMWADRTLTVGSGVTYAAHHQSGTKHMPARKMLPEDTEWDADIQDAVDEAVEIVTKRLGRDLR